MLTRSVLGGSLASVGATALLSPVLMSMVGVAMLMAFAGRLANVPLTFGEYAYEIVPPLIAVAIASLVAGYVAGAIARGDRGREGSIAALLGFVLVLIYGSVLGIFNASLIGITVAIVAIGAVPVTLVFGRIGAMLAPRTAATPAVGVASAPAPRAIPRTQRLFPAVGQKGGERSDDDLS